MVNAAKFAKRTGGSKTPKIGAVDWLMDWSYSDEVRHHITGRLIKDFQWKQLVTLPM